MFVVHINSAQGLRKTGSKKKKTSYLYKTVIVFVRVCVRIRLAESPLKRVFDHFFNVIKNYDWAKVVRTEQNNNRFLRCVPNQIIESGTVRRNERIKENWRFHIRWLAENYDIKCLYFIKKYIYCNRIPPLWKFDWLNRNWRRILMSKKLADCILLYKFNITHLARVILINRARSLTREKKKINSLLLNNIR